MESSSPHNVLPSCCICFDSLNAPKVLPCFHSFCRTCIQKHYKHSVSWLSSSQSVTCPTCRECFLVPSNGINGLKNDPVIERLTQLLHQMEHRAYSEQIRAVHECSGCGSGTLTVEQKGRLCVCVDKLEMVVSCLRKKSLVLYRLQDVTKQSCEEAKDKVLTKYQALKKEKQRKIQVKEVQRDIEQKFQPILNWMVSEHDCLYQKVAELKSLLSIIEAVLEMGQSVLGVCRVKLVEYASHFISTKSMLQYVQLGAPPGAVRTLLPTAIHDIIALQDNSSLDDIKTLEEPRQVRARMLFKLSGLGSRPGCFNYPTHATFLPSGDFLVCDKNNHRLQVFDDTGAFKKELCRGELKPRRARFNINDSKIYISDENTESVRSFDYVDVPTEANSIGIDFFVCPAGLAFDNRGNVVMSDPEKGYITVHKNTIMDEEEDDMITKFYFRAKNDVNVPNPYYVTVNKNDQIVVSDSRNNKVKIFNQSGQLLFEICDLMIPRGICVDRYGNIFIAEGDRHCISVYNTYGEFVQHLLTAQDGLCHPLSVETNGSDRLLVTQCGYYTRHEVLMYQLKYRY